MGLLMVVGWLICDGFVAAGWLVCEVFVGGDG